MTATNTNGNTKGKEPVRTPEYITFRLSRSDLHVNDADNVRKSLVGHDGKAAFADLRKGKDGPDLEKAHGPIDGGLARLAVAVEKDGLENPPIVRAATKSDKTEKQFVLVMGFRRLRALDLLGWDTFDARRPAGERSPKELFLSAVAENCARDNLSPYEAAVASDTAIKTYQATEAEIGAATGISRGHINNQIRCVRNLPDDTLAAWRDPSNPAHKLATFGNLLKIAALENLSDRETAWSQLCKGEEVSPTGAGPQGGETGGASAPAKMKARIVVKNIKATLAFVNSQAGKSFAPPNSAEWFGAFVRYLAGYRATPPDGLGIAEEKKATKKGKKTKRADAKVVTPNKDKK